MSSRAQLLFLVLVAAQAAHSIEEITFRLYDNFAPARFASELVSSDPAFGFALLNMAIVSFGAWCYLVRVRLNRPSAVGWAWFWVLLELGNGVTHVLMAIAIGGYFPGVFTAPVLVGLALALGLHLRRDSDLSSLAAA